MVSGKERRSFGWVLGLLVVAMGSGCRPAGAPPAGSGAVDVASWKGPVEGVRWSRPEPVIEGELHEYPDLAIDGAGDVWMTWVGFPEGKEQIYVQRQRPGKELEPLLFRLGEGDGARGWPRIAAHGRTVRVTWAEQLDGRFTIRLATFEQERLERIDTVSTGGFEAVRPTIALDREHRPWVAWEERRAGHFALLARRIDGRSAPLVIDETGELNQRPALAPGPDRSMVVAWDHYEDGRYDIRVRRLLPDRIEPILEVTRDTYLDQAPALLREPGGRVWLAWHTDNPRPLSGPPAGDRDAGAQSPPPPRPGRALAVGVLELPGIRTPTAGPPPTLPSLPDRPGLDEMLEFPQLARDRAGRIFLFARRGQGYLATYLAGDRWSAPIDLSDPGWGGRGRELRVAVDRDGTFHLAARWLHKVGYSRLLPTGEPAPPVRLEPARALPVAPPSTSVTADPDRGGHDGPFFGDLHTHTWISDGSGDPDEVFTRSRDRLRHDFVALTDHDVSNGNRLAPFEWAYEQLLSNFFNDPGRFITLVAYEWTSPPVVRGGAGHRNVYFPADRAPLYGVDLEAPDTLTLFDLLRSTGALTIPHHTSWTGTDWGHFDPALQPLFEIVSVHGNSEVKDGAPIVPRAGEGGSYAADGLRQGLRFGFVGGSDGHGVPWHYGVSRQEDVWTTGLTGIYAGALDRPALLDALRQRRCFATSGPPMIVRLEAGGQPMGSEVRAEEPAPGGASLVLEVTVRGTSGLERVELVRDGESVQALVLTGQDERLETTVRIDPEPGVHAWYLRVVQRDGAMAWSSPLWVRR